jgi:hypothetical protein
VLIAAAIMGSCVLGVSRAYAALPPQAAPYVFHTLDGSFRGDASLSGYEQALVLSRCLRDTLSQGADVAPLRPSLTELAPQLQDFGLTDTASPTALQAWSRLAGGEPQFDENTASWLSADPFWSQPQVAYQPSGLGRGLDFMAAAETVRSDDSFLMQRLDSQVAPQLVVPPSLTPFEADSAVRLEAPSSLRVSGASLRGPALPGAGLPGSGVGLPGSGLATTTRLQVAERAPEPSFTGVPRFDWTVPAERLTDEGSLSKLAPTRSESELRYRLPVRDLGVNVKMSQGAEGQFGGAPSALDLRLQKATVNFDYDLSRRLTLQGGYAYSRSGSAVSPNLEVPSINLADEHSYPYVGFDYKLSNNTRWNVNIRFYNTLDVGAPRAGGGLDLRDPQVSTEVKVRF